MWIIGYRELSYDGHDTNAPIEGYHSTLKATLKSRKCRMLGRRVDWLVHKLIEEVLNHFWYQNLQKCFGFVINKKQQHVVVGALLKARNIPDTLLVEDGGPAIVCLYSKPHVVYIVFKPVSKWACCTCLQANRGYICKHKFKDLRMVRPHIKEGSIVRLCGPLQGMVHSRLDKIFAKNDNCNVPNVHTSKDYRSKALHLSKVQKDDIEDQVCDIVINMVTEAQGNDVLMRHLLVDILRVKGSQSRLIVDMDSGVVHPSQNTLQFDTIYSDTKYSLKRRRDFLERGLGHYFHIDHLDSQSD